MAIHTVDGQNPASDVYPVGCIFTDSPQRHLQVFFGEKGGSLGLRWPLQKAFLHYCCVSWKGSQVSSGDCAPHWRITTEMVRSSFVTINQDRRMASFLAFRRAWCAKQLGVVFRESGAPQELNEREVIRLIRLCIWLPYHHGTGKVFPAQTQPRGHSGSPPTLEPKHCRIRFGSSNSRNGTLATRAIPQIWRQEKLRWSYPENQTLPLALSANEESISKAWVCSRPVQLST